MAANSGLFFFIFVSMIDIIRVYEIVRDIANKDQKGFVTPNVFNSFAQIAQMNVYNEMFKERLAAVGLRRGRRDDAGHKSVYKLREEELKPYIVNLVLTTDTDSTFEDNDPDNPDSVYTETISDNTALTFRKPRDLMHDIQMAVTGSNTVIEMIYDVEKANRILNSNLSAPTLAFPVCLCWGDLYQVFPTDVASVDLRYYRRPSSRYTADTSVPDFLDGDPVLADVLRGDLDRQSLPVYNAVTVNAATGYTVANPALCRSFDLPAQKLSEVVYEICQLIGINLRDQMLTQYGIAEEKSE
jgi:hypothetical protein